MQAATARLVAAVQCEDVSREAIAKEATLLAPANVVVADACRQLTARIVKMHQFCSTLQSVDPIILDAITHSLLDTRVSAHAVSYAQRSMSEQRSRSRRPSEEEDEQRYTRVSR